MTSFSVMIFGVWFGNIFNGMERQVYTIRRLRWKMLDNLGVSGSDGFAFSIANPRLSLTIYSLQRISTGTE